MQVLKGERKRCESNLGPLKSPSSLIEVSSESNSRDPSVPGPGELLCLGPYSPPVSTGWM